MAEGLKYNCPESGDSKSTKSEVQAKVPSKFSDWSLTTKWEGLIYQKGTDIYADVVRATRQE